MFSPEEGSCYVFRPETIVASFLASYGVLLQSDIQLYFKTPVCGAPFSYYSSRRAIMHVHQSGNISSICTKCVGIATMLHPERAHVLEYFSYKMMASTFSAVQVRHIICALAR